MRRVPALLAEQPIRPAVTGQDVVLEPAGEAVGALAAGKTIVADLAAEQVVPVAPGERVGADAADALLKDTPRRDLIVVSFKQPAVDRFHELVPDVPVAPGIDGIARFLLANASPGPGVVALQIPITFDLNGQTLQVTTPESVLRSHAAGYAVHVWLSNDEENPARLRPAARLVRRRDTAHAAPCGRDRRGGTDPCSVRAVRASVEDRAIAVGLERRGLGPQAYAGSATVRARGRLLGREAFSLDEGAEAGGVTVALTRFGRRPLDHEKVRATVSARTRGTRGAPVQTRLRLGR